MLNLLTANVTHEMTTPLSCIISFADTIGGESNQEEVCKVAKMINNVATMMKFQVRDLLDRRLLERGMLVPHYLSAGMEDVVSQVVQLMESQSKYKNISIKVNFLHHGNQKLMVDQNRVKQVLINLISNAIKFSSANDTITINLTKEEAVDNPLQKMLVRFTVID